MDTGLSPRLEAVIARHGDRWQIEQDADHATWVAVQRPTPTALTIHVGRSLAELAAKLDADTP